MEKFFLYLSAFVPMYFLLGLKLVVDIIFGNLSFNVLNTLSLVLFGVLLTMGIIGIIVIMKKIECQAQVVDIIECKNNTDQQFFNYFSLFVLFSLTYQIEFVSMFCVFVTILVFVGLVYIRNNLFNINPLLNICGYSYYEITYKTEGEAANKVAKGFYKGKLTTGQCRICLSQKVNNFIVLK